MIIKQGNTTKNIWYAHILDDSIILAQFFECSIYIKILYFLKKKQSNLSKTSIWNHLELVTCENIWIFLNLVTSEIIWTCENIWIFLKLVRSENIWNFLQLVTSENIWNFLKLVSIIWKYWNIWEKKVQRKIWL